MASYLLIESRDPFEFADVALCHDLARRLAAAGNRVTVFLVQNSVLGVRSSARAAGYAELARAGVEAGDLVPGIERVTRDGRPGLFAAHDQVWHW